MKDLPRVRVTGEHSYYFQYYKQAVRNFTNADKLMLSDLVNSALLLMDGWMDYSPLPPIVINVDH